jgi:hypothetical protein
MQQETISMEIVNPHAAGIDVGSRSHWVCKLPIFSTFQNELSTKKCNFLVKINFHILNKEGRREKPFSPLSFVWSCILLPYGTQI